jgi:copper(I)-binding protein/putative intracellular protease/amidase
MTLMIKGSKVAAPAPPAQRALKKVAILIFDNVQIIDYTGPYEVFGAAGLQVFTVATSTAPITTAMGMKVTPHYALDDAPAAEVLLIPGGGIFATQQDPSVLKWIQERSKQAQYVMSVCNGAAILAKTGLLDGLTATTTAGLIDGLPAISPKIKVVRDRRYVDNGKFITTAGLSSGIDGAIYVVSKLFGKGWAQLVALGEEYDWKGDSNYARANLADRHIARVLGRGLALPAPQGATAELLSTEGTPQNWEVKWQVIGEASPADVLKTLNDKMVAGQWVEQQNARPGAVRRVWKFNDQDGGTWTGAADAQPGGSKIVTISLRVERGGAIAEKTAAAAEADKLLVRDAWIQEMPPSKRITAAHLVIENLTGKKNALIGASAGIAGAVELHRAEMDNGMMRMRKLDRIDLPVGKTDLTGEMHIMLIDLKAPLKEGDQVALTLEFQTGVNKTVMVPVKKRQAE